MVSNFLVGGKLGDFLHAMYVVKHVSSKNNTKAHVHMVDIGWERGIQTTFNELTPILLQQDYIQSFSILENYEMDPIQTPQQNSPIRVFDQQILNEGHVDMGDYLRSPWLYKACWSEIFSRTFNFDIPQQNQWMTYNKIDDSFKNKIVIHRRYNPIRLNHKFPYEQILNQYADNVIFVSTTETDYEQFPFKHKLPFVQVETLDELFTVVNSCEMIVSNLTGITVIAHALNKLRVIELPDTSDAIHCMGEEKYSDKIFWYLNEHFHNLA